MSESACHGLKAVGQSMSASLSCIFMYQQPASSCIFLVLRILRPWGYSILCLPFQSVTGCECCNFLSVYPQALTLGMAPPGRGIGTVAGAEARAAPQTMNWSHQNHQTSKLGSRILGPTGNLQTLRASLTLLLIRLPQYTVNLNQAQARCLPMKCSWNVLDVTADLISLQHQACPLPRRQAGKVQA